MWFFQSILTLFFPPCAVLFVPFFLQFKGMIYMIELMHYCIFHALNQAELPDELDVYRLGGRKIVFEWITMIVCNVMLEQSVVAIICHWCSVWCWLTFMVHFLSFLFVVATYVLWHLQLITILDCNRVMIIHPYCKLHFSVCHCTCNYPHIVFAIWYIKNYLDQF